MIDTQTKARPWMPVGAMVQAGRGALAGVVGGVLFIAVWALAAGAAGLTIGGVLDGISQGTIHVAQPLVGLIVHFAISAIIGALYGVAVAPHRAAGHYATAVLAAWDIRTSGADVPMDVLGRRRATAFRRGTSLMRHRWRMRVQWREGAPTR
jgi:hypothetical protein